MTFAEFTVLASRYAALSGQRRGQALFNYLETVRSDLARRVNGCSVDPFYNDDNIPAFYDFVERNW